jgi:DNA-binding SARP family transcriptional activator
LAKPWRPELRVYLMGELCFVAGASVLGAARLPGRQGRLATAFLVTERSRPVPRDELAEVLWPGPLPASFDVGLSAIVSKLRAAFSALGLGRDALTAGGSCYQLVLPPRTWVDVDTAIEGVHLAEGALLAGRHAGAYGPAVVAAAILRRPFLPGLEGRWIDARRDVLRAAHHRALDCLAEVHEWNREHALALRAAQEAVGIEPYRESGYRRLMELHDRAGNPAESLRVYEYLTSVIARDLRTAPGSETRALRDQIARRHGAEAENVLKN